MSKERLEEIKEKYNYDESLKRMAKNKNSLISNSVQVNLGDFMDIIEQAERVQGLERAIKMITGISYAQLQDRIKSEREWFSHQTELVEEGAKLRMQNKRYREALEFYRERENYNPNIYCPTGKVYMSKVDYDEGYNAKKALEDG